MAKIVSFNAFLRGTGRSHLMANIAALLAADGKRVGVVDLDDSAPTQHLIFGLPEASIAFTLADSMAGRCRVEQAAYEVTPQAVQGAGGGIFLAPLTSNRGGRRGPSAREWTWSGSAIPCGILSRPWRSTTC